MQMQISAYPHMEEQVQRQFASKLHEAYGQAYGIQTNALDRAKLHSLKKRLSGERRSGVRVG